MPWRASGGQVPAVRLELLLLHPDLQPARRGAVPGVGHGVDRSHRGLGAGRVCATFVYGAQVHGYGGFWLALVPGIDAPGPLKMLLIPMMFVIEVVGLFIKHGVLAVRLFANIMGGHTVLGVILAFIAQAAAAASGGW